MNGHDFYTHFLVIGLKEIRSVNVLQGFPGAITFGVALPFDQIADTF